MDKGIEQKHLPDCCSRPVGKEREMPDFMQNISHEVFIGIIVTLILSACTWTGVRVKRALVGGQITQGDYYDVDPVERGRGLAPVGGNSWRATWALALGVGSFFLWLVAAPLVFPAIALSLG